MLRKTALAWILILIIFFATSLVAIKSRALTSIPNLKFRQMSEGAYFEQDSCFLYMGNALIEVVFSKKEKGGVVAIVNKQSGWDFITSSEVKNEESYLTTLWGIEFIDADGQRWGTCNHDTEIFDYESHMEENGLSMVFTWNRVWILDGFKQVEVTVNISIQNDSPLTYWWISIDNRESSWRVFEVFFPYIHGFGEIGQSGEDDFFVVPDGIGLLFSDPFKAIFNNEDCGRMYSNSYPASLSMQCFGYYDTGNGGLYIATYDPEGYFKRFDFIGEADNSFFFQLRQFPEDVLTQNEYASPYPFILGVFLGDWMDMAEIYGEWAINQWWCSAGEVWDRGDIPPWLTNVSSFLWTDGSTREPESEIADPISVDKWISLMESFQEGIDEPACLWLWSWNRGGFDNDYPEYLPPICGSDEFEEAIMELHSFGIPVMVYLNGRLWDTDLESYEKAQAFACTDGQGEPFIEDYTGQDFAVMCPGTSYWKNVMLNISVTLVRDYEVDGIYFDQIGCAPPLLCFNASHEHPAGGGNWWAQNQIEMISRIRNETRQVNPLVILGTESCVELYIPYFDLFWLCEVNYERHGICKELWHGLVQPIPMFIAIYHEYAITFGADAYDNPEFIDQYFLEIARRFVRGGIIMLHHSAAEPSFSDEKHAFGFLKNLVYMFSTCRRHLLYGKWLHPSSVQIPFKNILCQDFLGDNYLKEVPAVLSSSWMSPDGSIGYIFVNIADDTRSFDLNVDVSTYGESLERHYTIYSILDTEFSLLYANTTLPESIELSLSPKQVLLITVVDTGTEHARCTSLLGNTSRLIKEFQEEGYNTMLAEEMLYQALQFFYLGNYFQATRLANEARTRVPPKIGIPVQEPSESITAYQNVTVTVNVTDPGTGVHNVTLWYSINNGTTWAPLNMTEISTSTYQATILGYENCTWVTYKIIAYDNNGNQAINDNHGYYYIYHVIPEFPSFLIPPLFMIATLLAVILLAVIVYRRKHSM